MRIDAVELKEINLLNAKATKTAFTLLAQVRRIAALNPGSWSGARETRLRRNGESRGVGVESLKDQFLGNIRPVGIRGIKKIHPEFNAALEHREGAVAIGGRSPHAWSRELHGPKAQPTHPEGTNI
jgi:hypothetical protein